MPTTSELLELFDRFHLLPILVTIALVGVFSLLSVAAVSLLQSLGEVSKAYYIFLADLDESRRRYRFAKHPIVNYAPNVKENGGDPPS